MYRPNLPSPRAASAYDAAGLDRKSSVRPLPVQVEVRDQKELQEAPRLGRKQYCWTT